MVTLDGMRVCMLDESAQFDGSDYVANSTYDAMINETIESLDESAAKAQAKAILQGEDAKKARQLLLEASKLYKTDKEASKKKSKEAIKILKKLRDEAKKIDDENVVIQTCKSIALFFLPVVAGLSSVVIGIKIGNMVVGAIVGFALGAIADGARQMANADKMAAARTKNRRAFAKDGVTLKALITSAFTPTDKKAITRDAAISAIDDLIDFAEDIIDENATLIDKIKNIASKKKTAGEALLVRGRD